MTKPKQADHPRGLTYKTGDNPNYGRLKDQSRRARYVVEVVSDPFQFSTKQEAREALFEALTDLARAFGVEPPDDINQAFGMAS